MGTQHSAALEGIDPRQYPHIDFSEQSSRYPGPRYVQSHGGIGDTNTRLFVFAKTPTVEPRPQLLDDRIEELKERLAVVNGD